MDQREEQLLEGSPDGDDDCRQHANRQNERGREREEGSIEGTNEISPGQIVRESDAAEITPTINTLEIS